MKPTICLNMIVKNESHVIRRCLDSVKPFIDYWVIVDTGSTDGTQQVIQEHMRAIPGELHEHPWQDFAFNRNHALNLAKSKADYLFFIDADEEMVFSEGSTLPPLDLDYYCVRCVFEDVAFGRILFVKSDRDWHWHGVLHEVLLSSNAKLRGILEGVTNVVRFEGARSLIPDKGKRDLALLHEALAKEPDHPRYLFYLGHTNHQLGHLKEALHFYEERVKLHGFAEERRYAFYSIAKLKDELGFDYAVVKEAYFRAFAEEGFKIAEPLLFLARRARLENHLYEAYSLIHQALKIPMPTDVGFLEIWVYTWGLSWELALVAAELGNEREALNATVRVLSYNLPEEVRQKALEQSRILGEKLGAPTEEGVLDKLLNLFSTSV